jgi:hypothetical protein
MEVKDFRYLDWDDYDLQKVAEFLLVHNPQPNCTTVDDIKERIRYISEGIFYENCRPTYCGTGGWYVLFIPVSYADDGRWIAKPFLQTFTVMKAVGLPTDRS